jgi:hypothetical protein
MGQKITLSFWVWSNLAGIYCVSFRNTGNDRSYVAEYTINAANTWEKKTITLTMQDGLSGTWNFVEGSGLNVAFCQACGTAYQTTPGAWQSGNFLATANQVNFLSAPRNLFLVDVQLELGPVATPFECRPFGDELALCQRYYEKRPTHGNVAVCYSPPYIQGAAVSYMVEKRTADIAPVLNGLTSLGSGLGTGITLYSTGHDRWAFYPIFSSTGPTESQSGQVFYGWYVDVEL